MAGRLAAQALLVRALFVQVLFVTSVWLPGAALAQSPSRAQAQVPPQAKIEVLSLFVAEPGTSTDIELRVGPSEALPKSGYIRIRGLPATATLSEGFAVTPGVWSVPFAALGTLKVAVPRGVSGRSELTISLVDVDGKVLAETKSALVVAQVNLRTTLAPEPKAETKSVEPKSESAKPEAPRPETQKTGTPSVVSKPEPAKRDLPKAAVIVEDGPPKAATDATRPPPPAAGPPPPAPTPGPAASSTPPPAPVASPPAPMQQVLSADARQRNARMLDQGDKALALGNIASARQFYLRAADGGDGTAALRLAETYDPSELLRLKVQGITGDVAEARRWYERAQALGATEATARLARLLGR